MIWSSPPFQDSVSELPTGPQPPYFEKLFNLMMAAGVDRKPENTSFGDVVQQVYPVYRQVGLCAPQGSAFRSQCFQPEDATNIWLCVIGRCCVHHIHCRKPETLWRHCKNRKFIFVFDSSFRLTFYLTSMFFFYFFRGIKHLLQWRYMTIGQTPGTLSTLMHLGRPGR